MKIILIHLAEKRLFLGNPHHYEPGFGRDAVATSLCDVTVGVAPKAPIGVAPLHSTHNIQSNHPEARLGRKICSLRLPSGQRLHSEVEKHYAI